MKTLFIPLENTSVEWPSAPGSAGFYHAGIHPFLRGIATETLSAAQPFQPHAEPLTTQGIEVNSAPEEISGPLSLALINLPKSRIESEYLIAHALQNLGPEGTLMAAADNRAGGNRIEKTFREFGIEQYHSVSKNKARVVWGTPSSINQVKCEAALKAGALQNLNGTWTQAGIFGWNKIDRGSFILSDVIENLTGKGADFGCGYGFLSLSALHQNPAITSLICAEADARALKCAEKNLAEFAGKARFDWIDLSRETPYKNLDFILMNPPFHEGKKTAPTLGIAFIENAHKALRKGGTLHMVANSHLPYERPLESLFTKTQKIYEGEGFKVFSAIK